MGFSNKKARVSSLVAVICISIYIIAIIFGAIQVVIRTGERRNLAEREFNDLVDRAASSSVFLNFLSESYNETIRDFLLNSQTLTGIIISSSGGEFAVEKEIGSVITWDRTTPRFRTGVPLSGGPFSLPIRVEGQRNVTVQAVYTYYDYNFFQNVLRNALFAVLLALIIALTTLMIELLVRSKNTSMKPISTPPIDLYDFKEKDLFSVTEDFNESEGFKETESFQETEHFQETSSFDEPDDSVSEDLFNDNFSFDDGESPIGLYTPRGNIGWETYISERLKSELSRSSSYEQDLVFLAAELKQPGEISDYHYREFADKAVEFFSIRDLVFEKGDKGISVIIPNMDLDEALEKSEDFHRRLISEGFDFSVGLSTRSGRLVEADRLMKEAYTALEKAHLDPDADIIAFKSDLEKYRKFIRGQIR